MVEKGKGVIVNISSCLSDINAENINVYPATKSFVSRFSKSLRKEQRSAGKNFIIKLVFVCNKA